MNCIKGRIIESQKSLIGQKRGQDSEHLIYLRFITRIRFCLYGQIRKLFWGDSYAGHLRGY
jgi:hypothetical protein